MSDATSYDAQHRGTAGAYEAYFAGMDRTMRQKLAFVGAHFLLDPGARIADMGCGSGSGTYQLALLNPEIEVIGVDINPESVRLAGEKYRLPNLRFIVGDAAEPVFADDPLDGILSSSTLHHVYTFNGYSRAAVRRAIASHLGYACGRTACSCCGISSVPRAMPTSCSSCPTSRAEGCDRRSLRRRSAGEVREHGAAAGQKRGPRLLS